MSEQYNDAVEPLVTVYMPTRNRGEMAARAIKSVIQQDYQHWEMIVVDDGSDNGAQDQLLSVIRSDNRIKFFQHESPKGACAARNLALKHSSGHFITGLDDDDEFTPNRLSVFIQHWSNENSFLCAPVTVVKGKKRRVDDIFVGNIELQDMLVVNRIGNQLFCKREALKAIGGFDVKMKAWQDYDTWLRFIKHHGGGKMLPQSTYLQYEVEGMPSITRSKNRAIGYKQFIDKHKFLFNKKQRNAMLCWKHIIERSWIPLNLLVRSDRGIFRYAIINNLKVLKAKLV